MYGAVRKFCSKAQSWLIFCDLSAWHLGHVQQKIAQRATYEVEVINDDCTQNRETRARCKRFSATVAKFQCRNEVNGIRDHNPGIWDNEWWDQDQQILVGSGIRHSQVFGIKDQNFGSKNGILLRYDPDSSRLTTKRSRSHSSHDVHICLRSGLF